MKNIGNDPKGTAKIDSAATDGLLGVKDSLAYRIHEIERHLHNRERWFGLAVTPNEEIHVADRIGVGVLPFAIVSGDDDWGAWVQLLGSGDTPAITGSVYLDSHRAVVIDSDMVGAHFFQMAGGDDPDASVLAGAFTEFVYTTSSNQIDTGTITANSRRLPVGTKVWARLMTPLNSGKTVKAYIGLHEYEG